MDQLEDLDSVDRRIAELPIDGASNRAIARAVGMPEGTVKWRIHRLYNRFGVSSRVQFVMKVRDDNLPA